MLTFKVSKNLPIRNTIKYFRTFKSKQVNKTSLYNTKHTNTDCLSDHFVDKRLIILLNLHLYRKSLYRNIPKPNLTLIHNSILKISFNYQC